MQQDKQNISPIKSRILRFIEHLGISKRDFYSLTGISRGTLESKTGITEDTLTKLFARYPSLSPVWIFVGDGDMVKSESSNKSVEIGKNSVDSKIGHIYLSDKDMVVNNGVPGRVKEKSQDLAISDAENDLLKKRISELEHTIEIQSKLIRFLEKD